MQQGYSYPHCARSLRAAFVAACNQGGALVAGWAEDVAPAHVRGIGQGGQAAKQS